MKKGRPSPMKKTIDQVIKSAAKQKAKEATAGGTAKAKARSTPLSVDKWKKVFDGHMDSGSGRRAGTFLANLAHKGNPRNLKKHQIGCKLYASLPAAVKRSSSLVRQLIEHAVQNRPQYLRHLPDTLRSDRALALAAVANDGLALQYVKGDVKKDREAVLTAVGQNGSALRHAPKQFRCDPEVVLRALSAKHCTGDHSPLKYADVAVRRTMGADEAYAKLAVAQEGSALWLVDPKFRHSKDMVLLAYAHPGGFRKAARLALGSLQQDPDILSILEKERYTSGDFYKA